MKKELTYGNRGVQVICSKHLSGLVIIERVKTHNFPAEFILRSVITALFLSFLFVIFTKPVTDQDTLWGLTSGQYIIENLEIPRETDPFSFDQGPIPELGKFILSQSWLGQVIAYSTYSAFGIKGFVLFKAFLSTLTIFLVYMSVQRLGFLFSTFATGISAFYLFAPYASGRSHNFSFLFAASLIFLLERQHITGKIEYLFPIPFLMALWSNTHGGFIFGIVVILLYFIPLSIRSINQKIRTGQVNRDVKITLGVFSLAVLASMLNPNGGQAFLVAFSYIGNDFDVTEFYSPITAIRMYPGNLHYQLYFVFLSLSTVSAVVLFWKKKYTPCLLTITTAVFSLIANRYIPFFVIAALCAAGNLWDGYKFKSFNKTYLQSAYLLTGALITVLVFKMQPFNNPNTFKINNSWIFPVNAVKFINSKNIRGNIHSSYNTSGYVLFSTYPESKIFLDSRVISADRAKIGKRISGQSDGVGEYLTALNNLLPGNIEKGKFTVANHIFPIEQGLALIQDDQWKEDLNRIGAEIIIHEAVNQFSGKISTLILKLVQDPDWYLMYKDGTVLVFIKDVQDFKDIIKDNALPKSQIFNEILIEANNKIQNGETPEFHASIALAMALQGMLTERFEHHLNRALELDPFNLTANYAKALKNLILRSKYQREKPASSNSTL